MLRNSILDVNPIGDHLGVSNVLDINTVKDYIKVSFDDDDSVISAMIESARELLEKHLNVYFSAREIEVYFSHDGCHPFALPYGPIGEIKAVSYRYAPQCSVIVSNVAHTITGSAFKKFLGQAGYYTVRYMAGYAPGEGSIPIPMGILSGWLRQVAWMYENRGDAPDGSSICSDAKRFLSAYSKNSWL